jgi:hypothetical protein
MKKSRKKSRSAKKTAARIAGAARRIVRASRKAAKVASVLGKQARAMTRPDTRVEVAVTSKATGEAPEKYHFVLHDGRHLRSLYELVDELETMTEDTFKHHVNDMRNDFSTWVKDVFTEEHLANEISRIQDRISMQRAVLKHLVRELRKLAGRRK